MDEIRAFRNAMAEQGHEFTLTEAKRAMCAAEKFVSEMNQRAIENPEMFDNFRNMTVQEKQKICREFNNKGMEVSPDELQQLIGLILQTEGKDMDDWGKSPYN